MNKPAANMVWDQRVAGSNPATPTNYCTTSCTTTPEFGPPLMLKECECCNGEGQHYEHRPQWDDPWFEVGIGCEECGGCGHEIAEAEQLDICDFEDEENQ